MEKEFQAFITILSLVNPVTCGTIFSGIVVGMPLRQRIMAASKSLAAISLVLLISAIFGNRILGAFGVSLDAFSCAGGGILIFIGIGMMRSATGQSDSPAVHKTANGASLAPLILFGASPGTITGVITVGASHGGDPVPFTAVGAVLACMILLGIALAAVTFSSRENQGMGFIRQIMSSYMGVIVIAMGVQFMMTGIKSFLAG